MNESFVIPVNGLAQGVTEFRLEAGGAFFASYGNPDILNASVSVRVQVRKTGRTVDIDCFMEGRVGVPCDRCLAEVELPVSATALLRVGAGGEEEGEEVEGREIVLEDTLAGGIDLGQVVYDYVCTSIPLHKVHPDGGCDPAASRYLLAEEPVQEAAPASENPFAGLKNLLKESE